MFWSGNYIVVRELNSLLKDENVTLAQVLEADDILQECNADNKSLVQFLTRPDILAELITLTTEEPSQDVELHSQYRHASIASEVLTSHILTLSDRLSADATQMNRICDFINREPPLNPLLASFFSKTIEMLLGRGRKQDWYSYHIVFLRVLDFFKSRTDFLPNLFRHIGTSAIMDTFKHFIRLDLFGKVIVEWFEAHQFIETLIQILCGTYIPEELRPCVVSKVKSKEILEKCKTTEIDHSKDVNGEPLDKYKTDAKETQDKGSDGNDSGTDLSAEKDFTELEAELKASRIRAGQSANAASLLCDIILSGCAQEGCSTRPEAGFTLMNQCITEEVVNLLLQSMFTSPQEFRRHAIVNGCQVLLALLQVPILCGQRNVVELAVGPHLPLLHQALLQEPTEYAYHSQGDDSGVPRRTVGMARLQVATFIAQLAGSEVEEVATTLITLGTPSTLLDLFFQCPGNNFLHAQVYKLVKAALSEKPFVIQYAKHLLIECDLLTKLMDAYEENERKKEQNAPRGGYMGHVLLMLKELKIYETESNIMESLQLKPELVQRWKLFSDTKLLEIDAWNGPLGGYYPSENNYEVATYYPTENTYEYNIEPMSTEYESEDTVVTTLESLSENEYGKITSTAKEFFMDLCNSKMSFDVDDDILANPLTYNSQPPEEQTHEILSAVSPWDAANETSTESPGEGWARFDNGDLAGASTSDSFEVFSDSFSKFPDTFSPLTETISTINENICAKSFSDERQPQEVATFWSYPMNNEDGHGADVVSLEQGIANLNLNPNMANSIDEATTVELANNLLNAMNSGILANIVSPETNEEFTNAHCDNFKSEYSLKEQLLNTKEDSAALEVKEKNLSVANEVVDKNNDESIDTDENVLPDGPDGIDSEQSDISVPIGKSNNLDTPDEKELADSATCESNER